MGKILTKDGKLLTIDGKVITSKSAKSSGGVVGGIIPTGTKTITKNGKYDVYEYAEVDVNVSSSGSGSGSGSVPLFAPNVSVTGKTLIITDDSNGAFIEKYVTSMNDVVIKESKEKSVYLTDYFVDSSDSFRTRTYAKGILPDSDYSQDIYHYRINFYNDTTLLDSQIVLKDNKATLPTPNPKKEGAAFIGYSESPSSEVKSDLVATKPLNLYALFTTSEKDVLTPMNVSVKGYAITACECNGNIYIFGCDGYRNGVQETFTVTYNGVEYTKPVIYNPKTDSITEITTNFYTYLRADYLSCAVIGDVIYILNARDSYSTIISLDTSTFTLTKVCEHKGGMTNDRFIKMIALNNVLYLFRYSYSIPYYYDTTTNTIKSTSFTQKIYRAECIVHNNNIYDINLVNGKYVLSCIDSNFNLIKEIYISPYSVINYKLAAIDNYIYIFDASYTTRKIILMVDLDTDVVIEMNSQLPEVLTKEKQTVVSTDDAIYIIGLGNILKYK